MKILKYLSITLIICGALFAAAYFIKTNSKSITIYETQTAFILYIINLATQNLEDVPFTNATVPIRFILGALLLMTGLGTLIGFIPAEKAISIKPIEALREE